MELLQKQNSELIQVQEQIRYTIERDGIIAFSKKWELKFY